ncbi:MAG: DUF479 domain-containing protein [Saprospiraceae bacterium]|nr:DUF479 domain-containing protein [Saprospiraceae bacterium]
MNHLAHCFLSFGNEDLLLGNFIGDFVKGSAWKHYPETVQRGILLHRAIDAFTDTHPATSKSKALIRPVAGRYASPVVDVLYDHLLATHWEQYATEPFEAFAAKTYKQLNKRSGEMPAVLQARLPQMLAGKFLHGYTQRTGVEWVLSRLSHRMVGGMDSTTLSQLFFSQIDAFSSDFRAFFPDLLEMAKGYSV